MPASDAARVFTIPAGLAFVDVLAAGIQDKWGETPQQLAQVTVLVPTRRARRSLAEAFLRQSLGQAMLLPRMIALGDMDEDEVLLSGGGFGEGSLGVPEAAGGLRRQLMLTKIVLARSPDIGPDQAAHLALELGRLLDQVHTERLSFKDLAGLAPDVFAEHWQETLDFLKILTEVWRGVLDGDDAIDAADRRNRLFDAQAQAWQSTPPQTPVIAAGSTGSIPATADLLAVVAGLPQGQVVLPGLDQDATAAAWAALEDHHPQFGMARLLKHFGITRDDVGIWPGAGEPSSRSKLINAALTPAGQEAPEEDLPEGDLNGALSGATLINCPGPREEAAVIALIMRHALEEEGKTCALVTPDRGLARRVAAEARRWGLEIDDSAGQPLARTAPGAFLLLTARMVADDLAPVSLLAALKHPLANSVSKGDVRDLEIAVLRGPRPGPGIAGLKAVIDSKRKPGLAAFLKTLEAIIQPFAAEMKNAVPFTDTLKAHIGMAEALANAELLWAKDAGEACAGFVADLLDAARDLGSISAADYPAFLETLMAGRMVRPRYGLHPRLHIWGLLEARLQQADLMILGGLNDATWPPEAQPSPWMSRPMLQKFGLPAPERRIGLTAHDFVQAFSAPNVVLTRAERVDGTPTVASRWLLRLQNLLEKKRLENALASPDPWLQWVEALDQPEQSRQVAEPRPSPPLPARPRKLSVTQIEHLIRDPYAIYARHVLKLRPLDPLDAEPGAANRGIIIHDVLHAFVAQYPDELPADAERRLIEIGREIFQAANIPPGVEAFWWPRFERIAEWFIDYERNHRAAGFHTVATEISGEMQINGPAGTFTLTARADRIDRRADIGLSVIDYKTGLAPSAPQVKAGFSPQLPLEAAIAEAGGFEKLDPEETAQLVYLSLSGGRKAGEEKVLKLDVAETVADTVKGFKDLVANYDNPDMPYLSQPRPMLLERVGDYDHLARILEWRGRTESNE